MRHYLGGWQLESYCKKIEIFRIWCHWVNKPFTCIYRKSETKRMTLEGFLQQYKVNNWYVVTILPNAMRKEVRVIQHSW